MKNRKSCLFFVFIFYLLSFLFSCDLFSGDTDNDLLKKIDAEIAWANADRLTVTVAIPSGWGTSPQIGTNRCYDNTQTTQTPRKGYPFTVEFTPELAYSLDHWRAYLTSSLPANWTSDPSLLDTAPRIDGSSVSVPAGLPARGGSGSFTINTSLPVTLIPWCKTEPYVLRTSPRHAPDTLYPRGTDIVIYFNAPLALPPDEDLPSLFTSGVIVITADGVPVSSNNLYYNYPVYSASPDRAEYKVTISATDVPGDSLIEVTVGPDIFNTSDTPMAEAEIFSFTTSPATASGNILTWEATYTGTTIIVNWTEDSNVEVKGRYRIDGGGDNELLNNTIPNVSLPNFNNVRQGGEITGIREYEIFLDLYVEGIKSNAGSKQFKIWNIATPNLSGGGIVSGSEMAVSNTEPLIEVIDELSPYTETNQRKTIGFKNIASHSLSAQYVVTNSFTVTGHTPIDPFTGKFYGNGHTVTIQDFGSTGAYMGLFGDTNNAVIRDFTLVYDSDTPALHNIVTIPANSNTQYLGSVAGRIQGTTEISNIITRGSLETEELDIANTKFLGGITGYMATTAKIANCRAGMDFTCITGNPFEVRFGGLIGGCGTQSGSGISGHIGIDAINVTGKLSFEHKNTSGYIFTGGVVGRLQSQITVNDVEFSGAIMVTRSDNSTFVSYIGGFAGELSSPTVSNCHVSGSVEIGSFVANNSVHIGGLIGETTGTASYGTTITDSWVSGSIRSAVSSSSQNVTCGGITGNSLWTNYTNVWYEEGSITVTGLGGDLYIGGVIGRIVNYNTFTNCRSLATLVSASRTSGTIYAGGFMGYAAGSDLVRCYAATEVRAEGGGTVYAGGLSGAWMIQTAGTLVADIEVSECYATGKVNAVSANSNVAAGGLIGYIRFTGTGIRTLKNCYALGDVYADKTGGTGTNANAAYAGGLVGYAPDTDLTIQYSFARGNVSVKSASTNTVYAGGIIGYMGSALASGSLNNNAALGTSVTAMGYPTAPADTAVGRIYGHNGGSTGTYNYARGGMYLGTRIYTNNPNPSFTDITSGRPINSAADRDGGNTSHLNFMNSSTWENDSGLDFDSQTSGTPPDHAAVWSFGKLSQGWPTLANVGGQ